MRFNIAEHAEEVDELRQYNLQQLRVLEIPLDVATTIEKEIQGNLFQLIPSVLRDGVVLNSDLTHEVYISFNYQESAALPFGFKNATDLTLFAGALHKVFITIPAAGVVAGGRIYVLIGTNVQVATGNSPSGSTYVPPTGAPLGSGGYSSGGGGGGGGSGSGGVGGGGGGSGARKR